MTFPQKRVIPDFVGALASMLCFIHCVATPLVFIAKSCSDTCCAESPLWWKSIDYIFMIVSFVSIYFATRNTTKKRLGAALWVSWVVLLLVLVNEAFGLVYLPEFALYVPALTIVGLHFYNYKYCQCSEESCCV